ncbi:hypothetical protein C1I93_18000 [Micromonospora endophytica]|uniref:Uncharacterized protein n=2 Tax=Micromonospora endophytica TaxID=515350 RepID=A0A2W2CK34_9ACTN|nr:hypothetical protein C1I93_18000 [Micromonospora endophytica]RIW48264.1 hypothetical protein D3H59_08020 [Micromonospora endophytica]BCJ56673.1 hypothetical protein Jiend_00950 [Micromonospora endophytica]
MILRRLARSAGRSGDDRLLDGARAPRSPAAPDPLAELLRAAAAPARPGELDGEQAALAAFREARRAGVPAARPRRRRLTAGVVLWLAGLTATATAGVALAAAGLDAPDESVPPPAPGTVAPMPTGAPTASTGVPGPPDSTAGTSTGDPTTPSSGVPSPTSTNPASPSPVPEATTNLRSGDAGHCKAYLSKPARQREKALASPGFADLVAAAGGAENVSAYCRELLAETDPNWLAKHGAEEDSTAGG